MLCALNQLATKVLVKQSEDFFFVSRAYPAIEGESSDQLNIFFTFGRGASAASASILMNLKTFFLLSIHEEKIRKSLPCSSSYQDWSLRRFDFNIFAKQFYNCTPGCFSSHSRDSSDGIESLSPTDVARSSKLHLQLSSEEKHCPVNFLRELRAPRRVREIH